MTVEISRLREGLELVAIYQTRPKIVFVVSIEIPISFELPSNSQLASSWMTRMYCSDRHDIAAR